MASVSASFLGLHSLSTLHNQELEADLLGPLVCQRALNLFCICHCMFLQVYKDAGAAYKAIDQRLRAKRDGYFVFGSRPSSLDALLFSHLAFHQSAPVSAPELRQVVSTQPLLLTIELALLRSDWSG